MPWSQLLLPMDTGCVLVKDGQICTGFTGGPLEMSKARSVSQMNENVPCTFFSISILFIT